MGLFITFIFALSALAFASVFVAVPSVEDIAVDEHATTETLNLEDSTDTLAS